MALEGVLQQAVFLIKMSRSRASAQHKQYYSKRKFCKNSHRGIINRQQSYQLSGCLVQQARYFGGWFGAQCLLLHSIINSLSQTGLHIALVGNPNSGKSSLFNCLTGLQQKVGNFPGVTVEKKVGSAVIGDVSASIIDLPGTYSLYPRRLDEWVTYRVVMNEEPEVVPDLIVVVVDASNLKRNLLFCTQLLDLKRPVVVALTMMDLARQRGIKIDIGALARELGVAVVAVDPRKGKGVTELKKAIGLTSQGSYKIPTRDFIDNLSLAPVAIQKIKAIAPDCSDYKAIHLLTHHDSFRLPTLFQQQVESIKKEVAFTPTKIQAEEILQRYARIRQLMQIAVAEPDPLQRTLRTEKLDTILLHRRWGYLILLSVLFLLFQSVFVLAQYPMDWIEMGMGRLGEWTADQLPPGMLTDLLVNGVLAGLGGIVVFVPQIMILFGIITLLEDSGYMARISFLSDRLMRSVGLNGKSVMPMISGFACAVPAIMSTRNIENRKERLLTILVTPLMSCSARLPVYTTITGLVIPNNYLFGFLSVQGLVLLGMYMMGIIMAMLVSYIANLFIKIQEKSFFILELPSYRAPRWSNILPTMISKAKIFVLDAGKVIMIISLILWGLSSFGPHAGMQKAQQQYETALLSGMPKAQVEREYQTAKLENSFAGLLGKTIEPVIAPLGFDWKIGVALITSFAAREVFVGTMATLYSVGDDESHMLTEKMRAALRPDGSPVFTLATGLSLMIFYVFAMQCMSTLAVVRRETKSWKWPLIQLVYMTGLAYLLSWCCYLLFR
jgi:ferrous iron transport protein B